MMRRPPVCVLLLINLGLPFAISETVKVTVHANTARWIDGLSDINRAMYFNIHSAPGNAVNWRPQDIELFAGQYRAHLGRSFVFSSRMASISTPNTTDPAYVNRIALNSSCSTYPATLSGWPADQVDVVQSSKTAQLYANGCGSPNKGFVPGSHAAAGDFFAQFLSLCPALTQREQPLVEVANECNVKVGRCNTTWDEMVKLHVAVASAVGDAGLVCGPTEAYPAYQVKNWTVWDNYMKPFISQAGPSIGCLSAHYYSDTNGNNASLRVQRSGGNVLALMDLQAAWALNTTNRVMPLLVSEYGVTFHVQPIAYEPAHDWYILREVNAKLFAFLERPELLKAVPFIVDKATWFNRVGEDSYPWVLWRLQPDQSWKITYLELWYKFWAPFGGTRRVMTSPTANLQVHASDNGTDLFAVFNNMRPSSMEVDPSILGLDVESLTASLSVLSFDEDLAVPVLTTTAYSGGVVSLPPSASAMIRVTHPPSAATSTRYETTSYAGSTVVSLSPSGPASASFSISLRQPEPAEGAQLTGGQLRLGFSGDYADFDTMASSLAIAVDGNVVPLNISTQVGANTQPNPSDNSFLVSAVIPVVVKSGSTAPVVVKVATSLVPVVVSSVALHQFWE